VRGDLVKNTVPAGAIDSGVSNGAKAEDEFIFRRKGINTRRILFREEVNSQSLSAQISFINRIGDRFFLEEFCLKIDS